MFQEELKKIKMGEKENRSFSRLVGGIFILLAAISLWRGTHAWIWLALIGAPLVIAGELSPKSLTPVHRLWMFLAFCMGWVMTRVLLTLFYFAALTPLALLARVFKKKFLETRFREDCPSYWIKRTGKENKKEQLESQY